MVNPLYLLPKKISVKDPDTGLTEVRIAFPDNMPPQDTIESVKFDGTHYVVYLKTGKN